MILVVAVTGEMLTIDEIRAMRLPVKHGWEAWVYQDRSGAFRRCASYAEALALELEHPKRKRSRKR